MGRVRALPPAAPDSGGHWEHPGDVMGRSYGYAITPMSLGAVMDVGYPAAWYGAGGFLEDFGEDFGG